MYKIQALADITVLEESLELVNTDLGFLMQTSGIVIRVILNTLS